MRCLGGGQGVWGDAFLIPVRGVRRPARAKASGPPRLRSVGEISIPPTPPRCSRKNRAITLASGSADWRVGKTHTVRALARGRRGPGMANPRPPEADLKPAATREKRRGPPTCGRDCADAKALRTGTRLRRNPVRPEEPSSPGAALPSPATGSNHTADRREPRVNARSQGITAAASSGPRTRRSAYRVAEDRLRELREIDQLMSERGGVRPPAPLPALSELARTRAGRVSQPVAVPHDARLRARGTTGTNTEAR